MLPRPFKIYNTLTNHKDDFVPVIPGKVKFYSCGPTTYDFIHVGNARALVVGDLIARILRDFGYDVTFVRNFTDIDDKIIKAANKNNRDSKEHASIFIEECKRDMVSLGLVDPQFTPRATDNIKEIIAMVETLIKNGHAYVFEGEVLFHVPSDKDYGKLSKKDLESLEHGSRVEVASHKKHPSDFVLWKPSKEGEPFWESPWGQGRPGWHIECSAMAARYLGKTIDIHHGGIDLIFPHHENEIAQSEGANGVSFCHYWCHNEFLNFGSEKMSKSLGNVVTIRKFVECYGGQILRQILVGAHYRTKLDWNDECVSKAMNETERIHEFALECRKARTTEEKSSSSEVEEIINVIEKMRQDLSNDFNTPGALAHFFGLIRDVRRDYLVKGSWPRDISVAVEKVMTFVASVLGLVNADPEGILSKLNTIRKAGGGETKTTAEEIEALIAERAEARKNKDWASADAVKKKLAQMKIEIKDNPDGTTSWKYL
jgi:cysteinyl-tRNA synthetase